MVTEVPQLWRPCEGTRPGSTQEGLLVPRRSWALQGPSVPSPGSVSGQGKDNLDQNLNQKGQHLRAQRWR